jgi:predicted ATPase
LDGQPFSGLRIRPAIALCVYLACQPERHRREQLMELLWPEWSQSSAQQNLRQTVYTLRQALPIVASRSGNGPVPLILAYRETLQLNPDAVVAVDVHRFVALLKRSTTDNLIEATVCYRGDFLADFYLPDSAVFEEWANARREAYRRLVLEGLDRLTDIAFEKHDPAMAEGFARRQLEIDILRESAHRQLILALARSGQRAAALTHYEAYRQLIKAELGIEPSSDIRTLSEQIAAGQEAPAKWDGTTRSKTRTNLPAQMTSFLGREREVVDLVDLIREPAIRLVTLTGAGGTGKTRLALEVAGQVANHFEDGVVFVPLETLREPAQILPELMRLMEIKEKIGEPLANTVKAYLRDRRMLLVLDNFEQIADGAPIISDLLRATPDVKIIVTSREELRIYGENVYAVPPMALPPEEARTAGALQEYESVQLFVQRAHSVQREFRLTNDNAVDVAMICRGLDGLPLAIELAAARLKRMTPAQLREDLGSRLRLLASDLRDVNSRQRTLRNLIDWSYNMLSDKERVLFARLGVFAGGWTLEAAEAIAAGEPVTDVLRSLESLLEKNLVLARVDLKGDLRYGMLETIREYAAEKLQELGESDRFAEKHLDYFFALRKGGAIQSNLAYTLDLWAVEQANYLAAIEWGSRQRDISIAVRLAITNSFVWESYGWYHEALNFALQFRSLPGIIEPPWIASAIRTQAAGKAIFLREYELARELLREALEFDRLGNAVEDEAHTLLMLGRVDIEAGQYAAGLEMCAEARRVARENDIPAPDFLIAWTAEGQLALGRRDDAAATLASVIDSMQLLNDSGLVWPRLAEYHLNRGDFGQACKALQRGHEAVRLRVRIWRNFLVGVVGWLLEQPNRGHEDLINATRLLGANEKLKEKTGDTLSAFYQELVERRGELARENLSSDDFKAAWEFGLGWPEEESDRLMARILGDAP